MDHLAADVPPGSEGLVFLPYLVGERSPLMDPRAKGSFVGLTLRHGPGHMVRALLEGVAFALRQIIEAMADCGAQFDRLVASGNGLASPLWRQMLADILNRPLYQGRGQTRRRAGGIWSGPDCRDRDWRNKWIPGGPPLRPRFRRPDRARSARC
jgi:Sugar (pentulose and hexulose) kinases